MFVLHWFRRMVTRLACAFSLSYSFVSIAGEVALRSYHSVIVIAFLSVLAASPAHAQTDLTGKWAGKFSGVQVEFPPQRGPFGQTLDESRKGASAPRFIENPLQLEFDSQKNGLAVGTWTAGEFKQRFVCALVNSSVWNCVDAGGRASIESSRRPKSRCATWTLGKGRRAPAVGY
jgi:hypothetical protein